MAQRVLGHPAPTPTSTSDSLLSDNQELYGHQPYTQRPESTLARFSLSGSGSWILSVSAIAPWLLPLLCGH